MSHKHSKENIIHCDCCNALLGAQEIKQKHAKTGAFLNTCNKCLHGLSIPIEGVVMEEDDFLSCDILYDDEIDYDSLFDERGED